MDAKPSHKKEIAAQWLKCESETLRALLQGLFDSDGSAFGNLPTIKFSSSSPELAKQVHLLLLNYGIIAKHYVRATSRKPNHRLLIRGVEGFHDIESSIKLLYRSSYSITGSVIISFLVFISALLLDPAAEVDPTTALLARLFIFVASIGLLAISSGASLLLRLPDKSALQPGGLMKFYSPKSISLKLDNILTDSIFTHLDPITRIRMDEWSKSIQENLNENYLPNLDDQTRLERAREKILLMIYLKEFIPEIMT